MINNSRPGKLLIVGGSGFLSGTLAQTALNDGYDVWAITRGERPLAEGVTGLTVDRRDRAAFAKVVREADITWDVVVDCIAFEPDDIRQDIAAFSELTGHFVLVSTDFVFDPSHRKLPQSEETDRYLMAGYGGNKRLCEVELNRADQASLPWTIVRPCHIYGPGSQLGCLPVHSRDPKLIAKLKAGEPLQLVGGGHFLQQPILARDLAALLLSMNGLEAAYGQIYNAAGPDIIESQTYYQIIADILDVELRVEELSVSQYLANHPEAATFLCHRIYDLSKLAGSGILVPDTPIEQGLGEHVASLLL